jgi:hypothetical protein
LRLAFVKQNDAGGGTMRRVSGFSGGVRVLVSGHDGMQKAFARFLWCSVCGQGRNGSVPGSSSMGPIRPDVG